MYTSLSSHVLPPIINLYTKVIIIIHLPKTLCRMVHAFTCSGLTKSQYHAFAEAAGIGCVMDKTIDTSM